MIGERNLRVEEVAKLTGYKPSTIRKKLLRREIGYHKVGRIVVIPESEVNRILGNYDPQSRAAYYIGASDDEHGRSVT